MRIPARQPRLHVDAVVAILDHERNPQRHHAADHHRPPVAEFLRRQRQNFTDRTERFDRRLAAAAERIDRASNLLRTRVEIEREAQNQLLLGAMNRRAKLQLRLQQTVEGLSVVAISYYAIAVLGYVFKGMETLGLNINPDLASGIAVVPVVTFVALAVRQLRRSASSERDPL